MKAMLYLDSLEQPVAIFDEVTVIEVNQSNHADDSRYRIFYRTARFNAGKQMAELHRDRKMVVKLDDGRTGDVQLAHASMDAQGNAVGVLRVLGQLGT